MARAAAPIFAGVWLQRDSTSFSLCINTTPNPRGVNHSTTMAASDENMLNTPLTISTEELENNEWSEGIDIDVDFGDLLDNVDEYDVDQLAATLGEAAAGGQLGSDAEQQLGSVVSSSVLPSNVSLPREPIPREEMVDLNPTTPRIACKQPRNFSCVSSDTQPPPAHSQPRTTEAVDPGEVLDLTQAGDSSEDEDNEIPSEDAGRSGAVLRKKPERASRRLNG